MLHAAGCGDEAATLPKAGRRLNRGVDHCASFRHRFCGTPLRQLLVCSDGDPNDARRCTEAAVVHGMRPACRRIGAIRRDLADMTCPLRGRAGKAVVLTVLCSITLQPAVAGSICVSCDGPTAVYSCSMAPNEHGSRPAASRRALQYACLEDIARQYGHASCSVKRNDIGGCSGVVHMVSQAPAGRENDLETAAPAPQRARGDEATEPKTVVELAKRTAHDTKRQIDKSARSVSRAARSTWRCVTSLFQKC